MTDLCMHAFEDTLWDEFFRADDHIVPHHGFECANDHFLQGDSCKKPHCEVTSISSNTENRSVSRYVNQGREQGGYSTLHKRKKTMLEKDSWSRKQIGVFPSSSDSKSIKESSSVAFDSTRPSSHGFKNNKTDSKGSKFSVNDSFLGDMSTPVDNHSFSYPLGDTTHTGNTLDLYENTDSTDFLYDGWPEIGNFEDFDRVFRSCDSTFGVGTSKEDELGWLSSGDDKRHSGVVLKLDFTESIAEANISENNDSSKSYSVNDSALTSASVGLKDSFCTSEESDSYISFVNGLSIADAKDGFIPKNQINEHKKQFKQLKQSKEKRKEHNFGNGSCSYLVPKEVIQLPSGDTSHQGFPSVHMQQQQQQQQQELGLDSFCYLKNNIFYAHSDNSHLSDLTSVNQTPSALKSECTNLSSLSSRESSHASSQLQSMESSNDPQSLVTRAWIEKREKLHKRQGNLFSMNNSLKYASLVEEAFICDPGSVGKQVQLSGDKFQNPIDVEGVDLAIPAELGSSIVQERSRMSLGLDDISIEAASFCQLQLVMEWLDLRTKLCIRDGLYRLARSAEQRHNHANLSGNSGDEKASSGSFVAEGTNKWTNFMNTETDTNPIDRSIAHLLFHRPSNSSAIPACNS